MALQRVAAPHVTRALAALAGASFALRPLALPPAERIGFHLLRQGRDDPGGLFRPPGATTDKPVR